MNLPSKESFEASQNDVFEIIFDGEHKQPCQVEEISTSSAQMVDQDKQQFSVVFASSVPDVFEQGVYSVHHHKLGEFELFLVPVFGDEKGVHYEAVFT